MAKMVSFTLCVFHHNLSKIVLIKQRRQDQTRSCRYCATSPGETSRSSTSQHHWPPYPTLFRIHDFLLGTRHANSTLPGAHSTGAVTFIHHPTKWQEAACRLRGLEPCTPPVTRRLLTECLDKEGGSCLGEKVFVLKFNAYLLLQGMNALSQSRGSLHLPAKLPCLLIAMRLHTEYPSSVTLSSNEKALNCMRWRNDCLYKLQAY